MSKYSNNPEEITEDILETPITFDALDQRNSMTGPDRELSYSIHEEARKGGKRAIITLRRLVKKYPDEPFLANHLAVALEVAGKRKQSQALALEITQKHPDYLFGKLNWASIILNKDHDRLPDILGPSLRLRDLQPDRNIFHYSEARDYYVAVGLFHLARGRADLATEILETLMDLIGKDDIALERFKQRIWLVNIEATRARIEQDKKAEISVKVSKRPFKGDRQPPEFQHREIEALYEYGDHLPPTVINNLLSLPNKSLVGDIEKVLWDVINYGAFMENDFEEEASLANHALFLLGELKAERSLPTVLELLSLPTKDFYYWLSSDGADTLLWIPLYQLAESQLDYVESWIMTPGVPGKARDTMIEAVSKIASHQPGRRDEVIAWFERLMQFMIQSPVEDNIVDTEVATSLVWMALDIRATELKDSCIKLHEKGYVSEVAVGDLDQILKSLEDPPSNQPREKLINIKQIYRKLTDDRRDHLPFPQLPTVDQWVENQSPARGQNSSASAGSEFVPGRNEPCNCGSGKKYKKCCLRLAQAS